MLSCFASSAVTENCVLCVESICHGHLNWHKRMCSAKATKVISFCNATLWEGLQWFPHSGTCAPHKKVIRHNYGRRNDGSTLEFRSSVARERSRQPPCFSSTSNGKSSITFYILCSANRNADINIKLYNIESVHNLKDDSKLTLRSPKYFHRYSDVSCSSERWKFV